MTFQTNIRKEFKDVIEGWSFVNNTTDVPKRLEQVKSLAPFSTQEQNIINFMKEVQATRVQLKPKETDDEAS